jgi:hypothetical protein
VSKAQQIALRKRIAAMNSLAIRFRNYADRLRMTNRGIAPPGAPQPYVASGPPPQRVGKNP